MKRLIFAIAGLVLIITAGILEQIYIQKSYSEMRAEAVDLRDKIFAKDDTAIDSAKELKKNWLEKWPCPFVTQPKKLQIIVLTTSQISSLMHNKRFLISSGHTASPLFMQT